MKETEDIFPPFVNYAVAKMVSPYTRGMEPTEVSSATNAAVQAIKEAMAALKVIEDVTARVIHATCHPALLDPEEEQPKPKKGEPYPLHPKPDEAMVNVAEAFAEVIGLEKKRVAAYKNHIKTAQKSKKKLAVPASSMPLSELKGNQVIRTILEMSDELRPVLDKIGIGPNSKKEQLEELEEDPIFKSLRSMSAKMKRSAFGSDHGDDEPGDIAETDEFTPPPEPIPSSLNPTNSSEPSSSWPIGHTGPYWPNVHSGPNGPNWPNGPNGLGGPYGPMGPYGPNRPNGPNGPYLPYGHNAPSGSYTSNPYSGIDLYTDQGRLQPEGYYPRVGYHQPLYHSIGVHDGLSSYTAGPLGQRTGFLFDFLTARNLIKFTCVTLLIFVCYLVVCAFVTRFIGGTWFLCGFYEYILKNLWPGDPNTNWLGRVDRSQVAGMIISGLRDQSDIDFAKIRESVLEMNDTDFNKFQKGMDATAIASFKSLVNLGVKDTTNLQNAQNALDAVIKLKTSADIWENELVRHDALVGYIPTWLHIEESSRSGMTIMFSVIVGFVFFAFFGARTRYYMVPTLTLLGGYALHRYNTDAAVSQATKTALSDSDNFVILTSFIGALLTAATGMLSGANARSAIADAAGAMTTSLQDEVQRRKRMLENERTLQMQMKTSEPFLYAKLLGDVTSGAFSTVAPWAASAKNAIGLR